MPTPARHPVDLDRRLKRAIVGLTVIALVALVALRSFDLAQRRQRFLQDGERRAANLALMLAAHLRESFAAADASLRQLTEYSRQVGGPAAPAEKWTPMLAVARNPRNALGSISVTDAEGVIRHSTLSTIVGSPRGDTYVVRKLAETDQDTIVADAPFRALTDSRIMLIPLGRRLVDAAGKFDGAVVATFTPGALRDYFSRVDVGLGGHIWVFHPENAVLFHVPSATDPIGESATGNPLFAPARDLTKPQTLRLPARAGASAAIVALQPVGEPRLSVAVSLSEDDLLGVWRRVIAVDIAVIAFVGLVLVALLRFIFRQIDARAAAQLALGRAQRLDALGQLTGGVAHDFNNLLTVIMMNVSVLKHAGDADARGSVENGAIKQIDDAAKRAAALTQRLLAFARRQPLHPKLVDLNQLVRDLQPMLERLLGEDIAVKLALRVDTCPAEIDPVQFETALLNLSVNARDAMPAGGQLRIETAAIYVSADHAPRHDDVSPGSYARVAVSDNGAGIAPEHLARVFEPFFTTKSPGEGTGLGLSMVYGFVKQSGGHVRVQSEPGRGTTVRLYFPLAKGMPPAAEPVREPAEPQGNGEVVLLLEDEPVVRQVAEMMLHKLGYRVVSAHDGAGALARARELPRIDLFLTDVVLPGGMNGQQVAEQLQRERPGLRVLYSSGYSADALERQKRFTPALRIITKPYDLPQLARAIQAALAEVPVE